MFTARSLLNEYLVSFKGGVMELAFLKRRNIPNINNVK